jgi:hypothetical protein
VAGASIQAKETMNTVTYLQEQFTNLNAVLHGIAGDLTAEEWLTRPAPGQNLIGYTVWHMPRTQDHFLQTWIRGQTEAEGQFSSSSSLHQS